MATLAGGLPHNPRVLWDRAQGIRTSRLPSHRSILLVLAFAQSVKQSDELPGITPLESRRSTIVWAQSDENDMKNTVVDSVARDTRFLFIVSFVFVKSHSN